MWKICSCDEQLSNIIDAVAAVDSYNQIFIYLFFY